MKPTYVQLLVNLTAAREAVRLLSSMVSCGEQHSDTSREAIKLALEGVHNHELTANDITAEIKRQVEVIENGYQIPTHLVLSLRAIPLLIPGLPEPGEVVNAWGDKVVSRGISAYNVKREDGTDCLLEVLSHKDALQGQDVLVLSTIPGNQIHNERRLKEVRLQQLEQMVQALVSSRALPNFQLNLAVTSFCQEWKKLNDPNRYGPFAKEGEQPAQQIHPSHKLESVDMVGRCVVCRHAFVGEKTSQGLYEPCATMFVGPSQDVGSEEEVRTFQTAAEANDFYRRELIVPKMLNKFPETVQTEDPPDLSLTVINESKVTGYEVLRNTRPIFLEVERQVRRLNEEENQVAYRVKFGKAQRKLTGNCDGITVSVKGNKVRLEVEPVEQEDLIEVVGESK